MTREPIPLLVVDDDSMVWEVIRTFLEGDGYRLEFAGDGHAAWMRLQAAPDLFDAVILDVMMPHMDGLELLRRIKAHPRLQTLPVILGTVLNDSRQVLAGLRAGAYYYLSKPFESGMLRSVVATAVTDHRRYRRLQRELDDNTHLYALLDEARFSIRTPEEAHHLARALASACPRPRKAVIAIAEILVNAVEHGNLELGYDLKGRLKDQGQARLDEEIARRLADSPYRDRRVRVHFHKAGDGIRIRIRDQGPGFDWSRYEYPDPERLFDSHGRGILVARLMGFDRLRYFGRGNEVEGFIRNPG